jgi:hypothetical protein
MTSKAKSKVITKFILKLLVVCDLNCVLGYFQPVKLFDKEMVLYKDYPPKFKLSEYNVYQRPHLSMFLTELFFKKRNDYDFAIWSSHDKEETSLQIKYFLDSTRFK